MKFRNALLSKNAIDWSAELDMKNVEKRYTNFESVYALFNSLETMNILQGKNLARIQLQNCIFFMMNKEGIKEPPKRRAKK